MIRIGFHFENVSKYVEPNTYLLFYKHIIAFYNKTVNNVKRLIYFLHK